MMRWMSDESQKLLGSLNEKQRDALSVLGPIAGTTLKRGPFKLRMALTGPEQEWLFAQGLSQAEIERLALVRAEIS